MPPIDTIPWDNTDYGHEWEELAAAYFRAEGLLGKTDQYDPDEAGVPEAFAEACTEHDPYFLEAVWAWVHEHRDDSDLGGDVTADDAPWIIKWARETYLGRWDSLHQWGEMVLADELRDSDWGVTWEYHVNWDAAVKEADVIALQEGSDVFVFDHRGIATAATYRDDWLLERQKLNVGEHVLLQVFDNPAEDGIMQLPGKVRGKWQPDFTPTAEWKVAVEMGQPFGFYSTGEVVVFPASLVRRQPVGEPWRALTAEEVATLPTVRVVHRRAVPLPQVPRG